MLLAIAAALLIALGIGPTVRGILNAPDAYQDESGFHLVWCNNSPELEDVASVWSAATETNRVEVEGVAKQI